MSGVGLHLHRRMSVFWRIVNFVVMVLSSLVSQLNEVIRSFLLLFGIGYLNYREKYFTVVENFLESVEETIGDYNNDIEVTIGKIMNNSITDSTKRLMFQLLF